MNAPLVHNYVCLQCGPDERGAEVHARACHMLPVREDYATVPRAALNMAAKTLQTSAAVLILSPARATEVAGILRSVADSLESMAAVEEIG